MVKGKKTPFLLQFFGEKHAVFLANFAEMYPFMNEIAENCQELASSIIIHSLLKNSHFLLHFDGKKSHLSFAFLVKNAP